MRTRLASPLVLLGLAAGCDSSATEKPPTIAPLAPSPSASNHSEAAKFLTRTSRADRTAEPGIPTTEADR